MAKSMQSLAGRIMNAMWTPGKMKKLYLSRAKVQGEYSTVTHQEISKLKRLCRHFQKKGKISCSGSANNLDKNLRTWISNKLREKKRTSQVARTTTNESAMINSDDNHGPETHWVAYKKINDEVIYFASFGNLQLPQHLTEYLEVGSVKYNHERDHDFDTIICGHLCL
ncbi:uncharacterized protein LOC141537075 [Cotesia typhae]|uniref:uncharacterized protein LOC141537075 n=1 Tax=Cotesia typhae TaxID=2053667 RepID=UPI003D6875DA